jgi:REP element-mobilizing transposase RayT
MTLPRQVIPGCDYMITRRCSERRFFLRPDQETNNAFVYCLALAVQRAKVELAFALAMTNHYHAGIHDPEGNFPIFTEHFHGLLARCLNSRLGRFENFWSSEPTSVVQLTEIDDVLDKMVYTFTNPIAADLVDRVDEWPGVSTFHNTISGEALTATRPKHFFRDDSGMPETVAVPIVRPRAFAGLAQNEWADLVVERVRAKENEHRRERAIKGRTVLGRNAVLNQAPLECPSSHAPHFHLSPRVAAKNKWARIEALLRNRIFAEKYRAAFKAHVAGLASVVFPFGTYWMRKFGKVVCEAADSIEAVVPCRVVEAAPA